MGVFQPDNDDPEIQKVLELYAQLAEEDLDRRSSRLDRILGLMTVAVTSAGGWTLIFMALRVLR